MIKNPIYRRIYERQNQVFLGGAGILLALICMVVTGIGWIANQQYAASPGQLMVDGGKKLVTTELLEYLEAKECVAQALPMMTMDGSIEAQDYTWKGSFRGIPMDRKEFDLQTTELMYRQNKPQVVLEENCLQAFQKEELPLKEEEQQIFLEKVMERGIQITMDGGEEEEEPGVDALLAGISASKEEEIGAAYLDIEEVKRVQRSRGADAQVHQILISLNEIGKGKGLLTEIGELGFMGENPYEKELEEDKEENATYFRYLLLELIVLGISWVYLKQQIGERD